MTTPQDDPTAPATDQPGRRYRLSLEFGAANDRQAQRLGMAWAGTCAAEYGTRDPVVTPVARVTAEDLRERIVETATEWALMYPLANWPWPGRTLAGDDAEHLDAIARDIAASWGRDIADRMLAEVSPVLEQYRKAVEDAPAVATWTGACVECGNAIELGDAITWRLRWSPQGPIHEECR